MHIVRPEIEEERTIFVLLDEAHGVHRDAVGNILVFPQRRLSAFHVADARNAVHNALVVPVIRAGLQFRQQLGIFFSGRLALEVLCIADGDRVVGIEVDGTLVLHVNTRHTVARSRHDVRVIESHLGRSGSYALVPVLFAVLGAHPQMPFTYGSGSVSGLTEYFGQRQPVGTDDQCGIARGNPRTFSPPRIFSGEETVARRSAGGGSRVRIGESHAIAGQRIGMRRLDTGSAVAREIAESDIVGINQYDVRPFVFLRLQRGERKGRSGQQTGFRKKMFIHIFMFYH